MKYSLGFHWHNRVLPCYRPRPRWYCPVMQYGGGGTVDSNSESIFVGTIGFEYGWLLEDINENGGGGDGLGKPPQIPRSKLGQVAAQG